MGDQRGYTVVELAAVMAILALMSALAGLGGVAFVNGSKLSKTVSTFADSVSLARERAIGGYEQWRITFPTPAAGSDVVTRYYVESCELAVGVPGTICTGAWAREGPPVDLEPGMGLKVPLPGGVPPELYFDRTGRFLGGDTEIRACHAILSEAGLLICQPGSTGRLIRIRAFTGIIET